jgi:hypothetical protein
MLFANAPLADSISDYLNTVEPKLEVLAYLCNESLRRAENDAITNPNGSNRVNATENDAGVKTFSIQFPTILSGNTTNGSVLTSVDPWLADPA